ncbi:MAG: hydrogen gas-evolving membrane-bound hydrogenase subunit E, partial [Bradymonadaceae bacterium]
RQSMPIVFTLALIGAAGMAGVPLFNGFLSKEMFFEEIVHAAGHAPFDGAFADLLLPLGATLGGILSVAYSIRFVVDTFLGDPPDDFPGHPHDPSAGFWAPVAVLAALTLVGGIAPNLVARPVVEFAAAAAATGSSALEAVHDPHFKLWHGFTVPLAMSAVAFGGGAAIFALRRRVFAFYRRVGEVRGKTVFDGLVDRYVDVARAVTEGLQNGSLQRYAAIVVTTALVAGAAPFWTHSFEFSGWPRTAFNVMDLVGAGLLAAGALAAAVAERHRMQSLISVGLVGLMLALTFVHFSAPDLAMTQLSVEVVNVLLLLLALYTLPETGPPVDDPGRRLRDAALGTAAGAGVGFLSYSVMTRGYDRMADYFLINSYPLAHGENVVNVILVDFRAFDTMGEISVLVVAALGIASMSAGPKPDVTIPRPSSRERFPMILSHVTRPLMALVLAAAVYIFLRGHNNPGGGFIAGLVATVALVLQYVAHGKLWAEERMRIDFEQLAVIGVLIAIVSGAAAWLTGAPFLAQGTAELHLPIFGPLDLVSTLAFDTGVFLAVVGAVMSALLRIGEFNRKGSPDPIDPLLASGEEDDPWKA